MNVISNVRFASCWNSVLWISSLLSRPTFFCFLYSPVGHVFLPKTAPEALLVWSTYRTGFSLLLPKKVDVLLLIMVVILLRLPMIQQSKSQNLQLMELDLLPFHLVPTYSSFQKSLARVILRILRHKIFVRFSRIHDGNIKKKPRAWRPLFVTCQIRSDIHLLFFKICISLACFRGSRPPL